MSVQQNEFLDVNTNPPYKTIAYIYTRQIIRESRENFNNIKKTFFLYHRATAWKRNMDQHTLTYTLQDASC